MRGLLQDVRGAILEIRSLESLKQRLQDETLLNGGPLKERVSGSKTTDIYDKIDTYIDLEGLITYRLKGLQADKIKAFNAITALGNPLERIVLIERYLNAKSWKVIAYDLNLSVRHLHNIHRRAILHLDAF